MSRPQAIITDIEGTTTPVSFVHECLFPYARERIADFIEAHATQPAVREQCEAVAQQSGLSPDDTTALTTLLIRWIDEDRKATPLKALQGMIWEDGYRSGQLRGPVYSDVAPALRDWAARGIQLAVYSSGSVAAQQLIFKYSDAGDLSGLFSAYFDTRIGHKREPAAYREIAAQLRAEPAALMFLSDVPAELQAARAVGMAVRLLVREEMPEDAEDFPILRSFAELDLAAGDSPRG